MSSSTAGERLSPVPTAERIEELDVVRGFALIGIFLMNVEFFNRPLSTMENGMPVGLTGLDWLASWFVTYFVEGKFWTIFSLLFGMGFAVMLARAERAGRPFIVPYLRRILALAVFGALHFILLWTGDILFSYAVAAGGLLVLLYGRWRAISIALATLVGLGFVPWLRGAWAVGGSLACIAFLAIYLRSETKVNVRFARIPLFSFIYSIIGCLGAILAIVLWVLPNVPLAPRIGVSVISALVLLTALMSARYHDPVERRSVRLGASIYVVASLMMVVIGTIQYVVPPAPQDLDATAERATRVAEQVEHERHEESVLTTGTYADAVEMRARDFPSRIPNEAGFAIFVMSLFLIGVWFVRAGVMVNARDHMRLFRRLACYGLPIGIGLGLLGSAIATSHVPGDRDGFQLAQALSMLGSLPACLGYVGLIVVALNSNSVFAKVRVLAPAGRMALTNYLMQTVVSTSIFYGYGGGQWGLARSWQVVYVAVVFAVQVAFSHWWLARFRYGPMEWLWRAFTYRTLPAMRLAAISASTTGGTADDPTG